MLSLFDIDLGLSIEDKLHLLQGAGAPGGTATTDAAPVSSIYGDTQTGDLYIKVQPGPGTSAWKKLATSEQVASQISWREPVVVADLTATTLPTGTATQPIVVDGVTINDGDRVLFGALTTHPNVYIYDQATGTFVEDINEETIGDTLYVSSGTNNGKRYTYTASGWVQTDGTTQDELGFIRTFIGKNAAGSELPSYTSTNFVTQGGSLEQAIGELDQEIGPNVTAGEVVSPTNTVNQNIQALDGFVTDNFATLTYTGITTQTVIDSIPVSNGDMFKWLVHAKDSVNGKVNAFEIFATQFNNAADYTIYAKLKVGGKITGIDLDVVVNAGNVELRAQSTAVVDIKVRRIAVV